MLSRIQHIYGRVFLIFDAFVLIFSWLAAYYFRFYTDFVPVTKGIPHLGQYLALLVPVLLLWITIFSNSDVYKPVLSRRIRALFRLLQAHGFAILVFLSLTYLFSEYRFSRVVIAYFSVFSGVLFLTSRILIYRWIRHRYRKDKFKKNLLVIGTSRTGIAFVNRMSGLHELGVHISGFVCHPDDESKELPRPTLCNYDQLASKIDELAPDQVVVAMSRKDAKRQDEMLQIVGRTSAELKLIPDLYEFVVLGCGVENFDSFPILNLNDAPISFRDRFAKRVLDFVFSSCALVLLFPALLLISLLVKLTSRGPVFYGQERMGLDGTTFKMWKFRSMHVGAEEKTGAVWAVPNDDRRTIIGAFLRSTSLDELPQFWNVWLGDMSLVGPRPERPQFVQEFRDHIPTYMLRHKVKAGLTGWAQVNGWRGDTSLEKRIEFDLYYIRHWSIALDLKIILLTPFRGLVSKNAY